MPDGVPAPSRWRTIARGLLFLYVVLVACPIRYWGLDPLLDNSWVFALNWAAAHGLAMGRDVVWTTGPLSYLAFPQDIGNNIARGLVFQGIVWAVLIAILADLFFRHGFSLRNLTVFSVFFGFSAPLYWLNYMGIENLLLAGALVLLVVARWRGGFLRYGAALALVGLIPLIKLTGGILAGGAVIGYVADKILRERAKAWREALLAASIPAAVFGIGCWILLPSFDSFLRYLRGSLDFSGGYSVAMSLAGDPGESAFAVVAVLCIAALLYTAASADRSVAWFFLALLPLPLFLSAKHGFVRPDFHVINFFCFAALALGLIAVVMTLDHRGLGRLFILGVVYGVVWLEIIAPRLGIEGLQQAAGVKAIPLIYDAFHFQKMRADLEAKGRENWSKFRVGPWIRAIVQQTPVASLSIAFSSAPFDGLNLRLYPVVQRYAAYTPYLDGLNAAWIRDQGPPFLIFAWERIDNRNPWTETPATWLEVYRWYNTRLLEGRHLLLERRSEPRFLRLEPVRRFDWSFTSAVGLPESGDAIFWSMNCQMSASGKLRKLLFRVPEVRMAAERSDGVRLSYRAIPEVMTAPALANGLPNSLSETAAVLDPAASIKPSIRQMVLDGPGVSSYNPTCQVELFKPAEQSIGAHLYDVR